MARGRSRRGHGHGGGHENDERWLLTYSDMITLLMALFMVLFSISSVNTSKLTALQKSLQDAFSGAVLSGGKAIMLLNRRGWSNFLSCRSCGRVWQCGRRRRRGEPGRSRTLSTGAADGAGGWRGRLFADGRRRRV